MLTFAERNSLVQGYAAWVEGYIDEGWKGSFINFMFPLVWEKGGGHPEDDR